MIKWITIVAMMAFGSAGAAAHASVSAHLRATP
jgi:hypothetical protein